MGTAGIELPAQVQELFEIEHPFVIAGGYVLWLLCNQPTAWTPGDIDLFTPDQSKVMGVLQHKMGYTTAGYNAYKHLTAYILASNKYNLSVNVCQGEGPSKTISDFDLTLVQCGLVKTANGIQWIRTEANKLDVASNTIRLANVHAPGKTFERIAKYKRRGFTVGETVIDQLLECEPQANPQTKKPVSHNSTFESLLPPSASTLIPKFWQEYATK